MMSEYLPQVKTWYETNRRKMFVISGYAGCGKTTLARKIPSHLKIEDYRMLAPTGKAALVLGNAQTIHSYMYTAVKDKTTGELSFYKKQKHEFYEKLLIIDEISMVPQDLLDDLYSLKIPIVGLGDPAQLPPVNGKNDILKKPDILLTEVFRHDGGLLQLATDIRQKNIISKEYENVEFKKHSILRDLNEIGGDSIIICRYNNTRRSINNVYRTRVKEYVNIIHEGEKLMVLRNSKATGLMNGSIITVKRIEHLDEELNFAIVLAEDDQGFTEIQTINLNVILGLKSRVRTKKYDDSILSVDYAYAITCHKSQGSEFENVYLVVEGKQYDDFDKWFYTAVTRAKKKLTVYNGY